MPRYNMDGVSEDGYVDAIPAGVYRLRIAKVKPDTSKAGDEMWTLELKVAEGEHKGHMIWDRLVFTAKGAGRIKMMFKQLGLPVEGEVNFETSDILNMLVYAVVAEGEWDNKKRNEITFDGYHQQYMPEGAVVGEQAPVAAGTNDDSDLPF